MESGSGEIPLDGIGQEGIYGPIFGLPTRQIGPTISEYYKTK